MFWKTGSVNWKGGMEGEYGVEEECVWYPFNLGLKL